jgi:hypothetical protein
MTVTVWALHQQLTGGITETIVQQAHEGERQRTQARCPKGTWVLKVQEHVRRTVETMVGPVTLERPYFYCRACHMGLSPSTTRWGWWWFVNSLICNTPRRNWSPKCHMIPPSRSLVL